MSETAARLPDAGDPIVLRLAPRSWRPFLQLARVDRPVGWWLLLLPCWQSSALASGKAGALPHWRDLLLFLVGAIAMRGAGSTYNDIVDRDIDAQVERTRARPLPSGRVSVAAALGLLVAQCLVGLAVLLSFNGFAIALGFCSLAFVAAYPFMKRVTSWPQAVLGGAFAWGALMGWAAAFGSLALAPFFLYAGAVFWTIGYDTIYALQDVRDDAIVGVGSTARFFGARVRQCVGCLYAASFVQVRGGRARRRRSGRAGALAGLVGFGCHLGWQVAGLGGVDPASGEARGQGADALALFRSNRDAGLILFAGLFAEALRRSIF